MGAWLNRTVQPVPASDEDRALFERDLMESLISPPDWDTRSWLEYSFKRDLASRPSSIASSWVNLEFTDNPVGSTSPRDTSQDPCMEELSVAGVGYLSRVGYTDSEDGVGGIGLLTSSPRQDERLTSPELAVGPGSRDVEEGAVARSLFIETDSLQRTPVHRYAKPFCANRSWTFSGGGSEFTSPVPSLHSGGSYYSGNRPYSPMDRESSLSAFHQSTSDDKEKGAFICGLFQTHSVTLIKEISPVDTAQQLFNLAILTPAELRMASDPRLTDRAQAIVLCLKKKLKYQPELFPDVCAALKKAGVKVIEQIKAEVRNRYPEDTELTRSIHVSAVNRVIRPELSLSSLPDSSIDSQTGRLSQPDSSIGSQAGRLSPVMESLEEAVRGGHLDTAKQILFREVGKKSDPSLLFEACELGVSLGVLNLILIEANFDVNTTTQHTRTPLHTTCAALRSCIQTPFDVRLQDRLEQQRMKVESLLKHGADPTSQDQDGNTALHLATLRKDSETVGILLRHSTSCIDLTNRLGNTALHIGCREGHAEVVRLLCASGANPVLPNSTRKQTTPVLVASSHDHVGVAQTTIDHDFSSLNGRDSRGRSPLHTSTRTHNPTLTDTLCEHEKVEPCSLDVANKTPLHYACHWGSVDLVEPLLNRDSTAEFINAQDSNGDTALHIACRRGHKEAIKMLVTKGAVKDIKNQDGKTAVDLATQWEHNQAVKLRNKRSPWFKRRRRRSSINLRQVDTQASLSSESSVELGMAMSSAESDCDETVDHQL